MLSALSFIPVDHAVQNYENLEEKMMDELEIQETDIEHKYK